MLQAKGFNISQIQAVAIGDGPVRMQALISGAVEAVCLAPPHDLMLRKMGYHALARSAGSWSAVRGHADLGSIASRKIPSWSGARSKRCCGRTNIFSRTAKMPFRR